MSGWTARLTDVEGKEYGITGKQLCQSVFTAAFEEFGASERGEGRSSYAQACEEGAPLLIVSAGPQLDALEGLSVPPNALCRSYVAQVDILQSGLVDMFVTHGGQNSFMESMANGVPLVVVPGFADQPVNGRKAEAMGVGLAVARPEEDTEAVLARYVQDLRAAMRSVFEQEKFRAKAREMGALIAGAGGSARAADIAEAIAATARGSETAAASATAPRKSYGDMFREMSAQAEAEASK